MVSIGLWPTQNREEDYDLLMVEPRDLDVVFREDEGDGGCDGRDRGRKDYGNQNESNTTTTTNTNNNNNNAPNGNNDKNNDEKDHAGSEKAPPETTGNRIYGGLLGEYYDRYFYPIHGGPTEQTQEDVRKLLLDRFQQTVEKLGTKAGTSEAAAAGGTGTSPAAANGPGGRTPPANPNNPGSNSNNSSNGNNNGKAGSHAAKTRFLVRRKEGNSFCFTKVFLRSNIDQKIKESFERMRRHRGDIPAGRHASGNNKRSSGNAGNDNDNDNERGESTGDPLGAPAAAVPASSEDGTGATATTNPGGRDHGDGDGGEVPARATTRDEGAAGAVGKNNREQPQTTSFRLRGDDPKKKNNNNNSTTTTTTVAATAAATQAPRNTSSDSCLVPMAQILVSPYQGNRSAEVGEEPLDQWKALLEPCGSGSSNNNNKETESGMNPLLSRMYGDPLALSIFRARSEIARSDQLYDANWNYGKIGESHLGWIPRRQLLLCLSEEKIGNYSVSQHQQQQPSDGGGEAPKESSEGKTNDEKVHGGGDNGNDANDDNDDNGNGNGNGNSNGNGNDENSPNDSGETGSLQTVVRKLECFELVVSAMKEWKLKYDYPELYSNKDGTEFVFQQKDGGDDSSHQETKRRCYRCQIFVARVFATLLLLKQEKIHEVGPTLMAKVRSCLAIMNRHAEAHSVGLAKILRKKHRVHLGGDENAPRRSPGDPPSSSPDAAPEEERQPPRARSRRSRERRNKPAAFFLEGTPGEREATLEASFALLRRESENLVRVMDFFRDKLVSESGRSEWDGEIRDRLEKELLAEAKCEERVRRHEQKRKRKRKERSR